MVFICQAAGEWSRRMRLGSLHFVYRPSFNFNVMSQPNLGCPRPSPLWFGSSRVLLPFPAKMGRGSHLTMLGRERNLGASLAPYIKPVFQFSALFCTLLSDSQGFPGSAEQINFLLAGFTHYRLMSLSCLSDKSVNIHSSLSSFPWLFYFDMSCLSNLHFYFFGTCDLWLPPYLFL